jgi:hypothetical protein
MSMEERENMTANEDLAVPGEEAESVIGGAGGVNPLYNAGTTTSSTTTSSTSKPPAMWNQMTNRSSGEPDTPEL